MKKPMSLLLTLALLGSPALAASTIAIVDSGTDFEHELLSGKSWTNKNEIAGNLVDDDRNGKVDDRHGWNFAEGSGTLFVRDHLNSINPIIFPIFRIIANLQDGTITPDEKTFWEKNVTSLSAPQKQALLTHLNFYGQYSHGTHVAGIASAQSPDSQILVGRMFPDDPPRDYAHPQGLAVRTQGVIDYLYGMLATLTNATFDSASGYLNENKVDVANYSLGVGLQMIAKQSLILRGTKEPTAEQISEETHRLFKQYEPKGKVWMAKAPATFFVIAAGNDGSDNDALPIFPGSVRAENAITVAATQGVSSLASFSNYGKTSVDIAAPGVSIMSSVPSLNRSELLPMSGTSMAAPYVTGVAGRIKTINPDLTPAQNKAILMGTVDVKEWLKDKVISSGVVNAERAYQAAQLSRTLPLDEALRLSREQVKDIAEARSVLKTPEMKAPADLVEIAGKLIF
ncbi:MAG: S8 family serine peptidase [Bdellovibrionaceae bacterium]|nr:S8 family serine peptidase [Pseudobdellovibrionaceae bacterium]